MTVALDIVSRALKDIGALEAGKTPSADSAQGAIANSGNATTDAILAALRTHGLIAT